MQRLAADIRAAVPDAGFAVEHSGGYFAEPRYPGLHPDDIPPEVMVAPISDLPMLGWCGTAYAVANAHPDVLALADQVCASNDEDGVAQAIERLDPVGTR